MVTNHGRSARGVGWSATIFVGGTPAPPFASFAASKVLSRSVDVTKAHDMTLVGGASLNGGISLVAAAVDKCHTPFREIGNEASIRVPRMFKSHAWQQYDKQMQCY
jgi:hypothetical protein